MLLAAKDQTGDRHTLSHTWRQAAEQAPACSHQETALVKCLGSCLKADPKEGHKGGNGVS